MWVLGPSVTLQHKISVKSLLGEISIFYSEFQLSVTSDMQGPPFCSLGQQRLESTWRAGTGRTSERHAGLVEKLGPSLWNTSSALRCTASRPLKVLVSQCQVCKMRSMHCKEPLCNIEQLYIVWWWPRPVESTKLGQRLGQELMLQRGEAILKCSNTDSEDFLGQMEVGTMFCRSFYPWCISKKCSATSILYSFSLLETTLCKLSLIKTSFFMCPQLIP